MLLNYLDNQSHIQNSTFSFFNVINLRVVVFFKRLDYSQPLFSIFSFHYSWQQIKMDPHICSIWSRCSFEQIQTSQTGGQPFSDTSPNSECYLHIAGSIRRVINRTKAFFPSLVLLFSTDRFVPELLNLPVKVINCLVEKKMLKFALKMEMKQQLLKLKPTSECALQGNFLGGGASILMKTQLYSQSPCSPWVYNLAWTPMGWGAVVRPGTDKCKQMLWIDTATMLFGACKWRTS